ncbi:hypothetical protein [Phenylobacterium montanum]|uniref:Uncharacterized protein n=1 Tax=Phenylobacterium montanum TaxID=2823693 RepID=A0A975G1N2_9CAUL|nr:hypothetical protein [Caulobacter sp. S6]QUD88346.1 hypothetical protein KCG34_00170 [Caulobacter sp. S6]
MSMPSIRRDVALMLAQANIHIDDAEALMKEGPDRARMHAAGKLAVLKRQKEVLEQRLAEIDRRPDAEETMLQWIKEEAFSLSLGIERWIANS